VFPSIKNLNIVNYFLLLPG